MKQLKTPYYEMEDMKNICMGMSLGTNDPLGLGGLLSDATRITQLIIMVVLTFLNFLKQF